MLNSSIGRFLAILGVSTLTGLSSFAREEGRPLPDIKKKEFREDFNQMTDAIKQLYGPLEFKERRFGYKVYGRKIDGVKYEGLDDIFSKKLSAAKTEEEHFGVFAEYLASLQDGHVSFHLGTSSNSNYIWKTTPVLVTPVGPMNAETGESTFAVESYDPTLAENLSKGDILLSVDGVPTYKVVKDISKYIALGNPLSDRYASYFLFNRRSYFTAVRPTKDTVTLELRKNDGSTVLVDLVWTKQILAPDPATPSDSSSARAAVQMPWNLADLQRVSLNKMGSIEPIFLKDSYLAQNFVRINFSVDDLKAAGIMTGAPGEVDLRAEFYAAQYKHKGKTVLLIRNPTYAPDADPGKLTRLYAYTLKKYVQFADVIVIDQTHNPGGSVDYVHDLFALYAKGQQSNFVQFFNADRAWVEDLRAWSAYMGSFGPNFMAVLENRIGDAMRKKKRLIEAPMSFDGSNYIQGADLAQGKPILVLVDELAGSGGDAFPMLMQRSGRAKLFGQRTMGLGGNVVPYGPLDNTRAYLSVTRGLFTSYDAQGLSASMERQGNYADSRLIENNGNTPDFDYIKTREDMMYGHISYITTFMDAALKLLESPVNQ